MNKLQLYSQIFKNMGWDYFQFRTIYEIKRKTGLLKKQFPVNPLIQSFITLKDWKKQDIPFFFESKAGLSFPKKPAEALQKDYLSYKQGKLRYFNAKLLDIGKNYDWITNPSSGYRYDISKHWTEIEDITQEAGDIKFTWEKSRFSFLSTLIRYDYHYEKDCAKQVLDEIESWINANPINQGPNYKCSQEMSIRIMNWTFALYYYKHSEALTEELFQKIMHFIYWHVKHVAANINFSRKTVRNNHAITEVLMLYLSGLLFPFFPEASKWKRKGKQWFEEEVAYQVYDDGTFLQFSHNYHRVLIQLLTWAFYLAELHSETFSELTYNRASKSLNYLFQCTDKDSGHLPNYGMNDGALFFNLNNQPYRDYRPQLNALNYFFNRKYLFEQEGLQEDVYWFANRLLDIPKMPNLALQTSTLSRFEKGGYYLIRDLDTFSFIRSGQHKDRPAQADNLHLDLWYQGKNLLRDAGTYKYNTEPSLVKYFNGTSAHNTVSLGKHDQMLKGPRFIWLYWSQALSSSLDETETAYLFKGKVKVFQQLDNSIVHQRQIKKHKQQLRWEVIDHLTHNTDLPMIQHWNISESFDTYLKIEARDETGKLLTPQYQDGYYSSLYGVKEKSRVITFQSEKKKIITIIEGI